MSENKTHTTQKDKQKIRIKDHYSTFRRPRELHQASLHLFYHYVPELIQYLYRDHGENHRLFGDPEIRVGLAIKILHNTPTPARYPPSVLEPVLNDIENMLKDRHYLASIDQPNIRIKCLRNEFDLVQRYVDLDETVSLNAPDDDQTLFDTVTNALDHEKREKEQGDKHEHRDGNDDAPQDVDHTEGCIIM